MPSLRIGVLASGRGSNLQAILDASRASWIRSKVVVVITDVPGAPALERAAKAKVATETIPPPEAPKAERRRAHDRLLVAALKNHAVDLVVLAGYMRIVSDVMVKAYPNRILNIHPALLPAFPGLHAQRQAIEWGARVSGCTTHFVDEAVDHGPIILQAAVSVSPSDTDSTLAERILTVEHQLLPRTIRLIEDGRVRVDGRRVSITPGPAPRDAFPTLPGVLYSPGY